MDGGKGTLFGALCGVLTLGLISDVLTLAHVPGNWLNAIDGVMILGRADAVQGHVRQGTGLAGE